MKITYEKFNGFENIFLEDSFVLEITEKSNEIKFLMELVLAQTHPMYSKPKPNEIYCYKKAELLFPNAKEINWIEKTLMPSKDATGEIDYGNIDELYLENGIYCIWGDFGHLELKSSEPQIKYL